jgi:hypothetical protein
MKQKERFLILGLFALILLSVACATNVFATDEATVIGTVYATTWDDNDNVIGAVIVGSGEEYEEYVIVENAAGKELFKLVHKAVKASGVIGKDSKGNKTITVTKYEVMLE